MGHIKEPKGVDLFIKSDPLTEEARLEISAYIKNYEAKVARRRTKKHLKTEAAVRPYA